MGWFKKTPTPSEVEDINISGGQAQVILDAFDKLMKMEETILSQDILISAIVCSAGELRVTQDMFNIVKENNISFDSKVEDGDILVLTPKVMDEQE